MTQSNYHLEEMIFPPNDINMYKYKSRSVMGSTFDDPFGLSNISTPIIFIKKYPQQQQQSNSPQLDTKNTHSKTHVHSVNSIVSFVSYRSVDCSTPMMNGMNTEPHDGNITPFSNKITHDGSKSLSLVLSESPTDDDPIHIAHIHDRTDDDNCSTIFDEIRKSNVSTLGIEDSIEIKENEMVHNTFISLPGNSTQLMSRASILTILSSGSIESINDQTIELECLNDNGYVRENKIHDRLNGEIFDAKDLLNGNTVVIKKTYKLFNFEMNDVVKEANCKEAIIMHYLTVDNKPTNGYIGSKYINFFESDDAYYLVMEKAGNINLHDFNIRAHQLISEGKMKIKSWRKIVKYVFWQLSVIMYWLHEDVNCCHLDLRLSNIMLINGNFIENKQTGKFVVDPNLQLRLIDFSCAEVFNASAKNNKMNLFKCTKYLSEKTNHLSAPKVYCNQIYDAKKADIWSMGICLYQLAIGMEPYSSQDFSDQNFYQILNGNILGLIRAQGKTKNVNNSLLNSMTMMLNVTENDRINISEILENEWLGMYWNQYKTQVKKKSEFQAIRNKTLHKKMQKFPYYKSDVY